ncbi:hypothetical protein [Syntrophomonas wolfei]|uniref:Uncharacterized protein n=1 Tax=Syntrophomonas wolfei subsp. wolfei (strain DSM 2245B / Goettingen) TaxID=335541 RepID=Q0B059_SYNWW|nr:hypothetical protein [Syntrophomonas wolfei]ABI67645.1 hypothetical protein Swol_0301 [Syntrophomonas wolfei subsp. wolfei str. Goettingen G311]
MHGGVRLYVGIRTVGRPDQVLQKIKHSIQRSGLAKVVPIIKIEKRAAREFYLFLAVETSDSGTMPGPITQALKMAGIKGEKIWPLSIDEIKRMTASMDIDIHAFNSLRYRSRWQNEALSFEEIEESQIIDSNNSIDDDPELGNRYNQLLYWLSASGTGSWYSFAKTCVTLGLVDDARKTRNVFRRLRLLGHMECSQDGLRWQICPSTMVFSPGGDFGFLCGQRTPEFEEQLGRKYPVTYINQPSFEGPSAIRINIKDQACNNDVGIIWAGITSLSLANLLPDINGWKQILPIVDRLNIHNYHFEKWEDNMYFPYNDFVQREKRYEGKSGLYRLTQNNAKHLYRLNLYFDYEQQRWLKGDWYGLRFLSVHDEGKNIKAYYDSERSHLVIQNDQRWPLVYEKALVLASGRLPELEPHKHLQLYREVPAKLSSLLANKLDVSLEVKDYA